MPIDINATDFVDRFNAKDITLGVVGHGYVGQAVDYFFHGKVGNVLIHDKAKPQMHSLKDVVDAADVIFVCVPTPMNRDGSCHTNIVESVVDQIVSIANSEFKPLKNFVVVIKSTIPPGFTLQMKAKHPGLRIVFSPEFLTEANSVKDMLHANRIIFGGDVEDGRVLFKLFESRLLEKVEKDEVTIANCDSTVAEMVKLFTNGILATKVAFCNEINKMCESLGISYEEVRVLACLDHRVGKSHTVVPGPDGKLGFGGSCFPKDINNLADVCKHIGVDEKVFSAVIKSNESVRHEKDWEDLKGRAVVDGE